MTIFDDRPCELGEGPLWHPERQQLFWFDIFGKRLLTTEGGKPAHWQFEEHVSAAGWIDRDTLLIASESALFQFDLTEGKRTDIVPLDADNDGTRSNDGRADPFGGFWIGTMDKANRAPTGAIFRYFRGELRQLYAPVTIPNAICFTPDARYAHFADTTTRKVYRVLLDGDGWPASEAQVFIDLKGGKGGPDGAVVDEDGILWLAEWGAARVAAYRPDGSFLRAFDLPAPHTSCPAFGGPDRRTLFCTSALKDMDAARRADWPDAGKTFAIDDVATGQAEHRVMI